MEKEKLNRLEYKHQCVDCGRDFKGFEHQTHCWDCMLRDIKNHFGIEADLNSISYDKNKPKNN